MGAHGSGTDGARWVVTGGVGFIGSHVVGALRARGDEVVIIDDFSEGETPAADKERHLRELEAAHGSLRVLRACVTDRAAIAPCFAGSRGVIHLAALAGVRPSVLDPARYARVNVEGTATVIEAARAAGAQRVVIASSSSIYGSSTALPAQEDAPATEPESPYAATKRSAELVSSALALCHPELAVAQLRFFTVYGPRQRPEMAIARFMRRTMRGEPITVYGDGSMRRDFTHVADIVRGVLAAADRVAPGYRVYNLGAGAPVTLTDLVRAIGEVVGREPLVEHGPRQPGDAEATWADISRARAELDWSPAIGLRDGLVSVRDWIAHTTE
jgi:UDP-glucuronate 4-epimerase